MNFGQVRLLSYEHTNQLFGDLFHYATRKNVSIEGSLFDLTNQSGVSTSLWTGAAGLLQQDYSDVVINGINMGSGRLLNLSFPEDQGLQEKTYNADLEIFLTGNLYNLTGTYYQGVSAANFNLIDTFNESFNYNRTVENQTFTHSVNLRVFSGAGDALIVAKGIAAALQAANQVTGLFSGYNVGGKKYYQETVDKISNEYGFTETFEAGLATGNYSLQLSHSLQLAEDGFVTVTENGALKGLTTSWTDVTNGIGAEVAQSYGRCNGMITAYGPSTSALNTKILTLGKQLGEFDRSASYTVAYTNNLALRTGFSWIYTHNVRKQDGVVDIAEQGEILGWGRLPTEKFTAAKAGYDGIKGGIQGRAQSLYNTAGTLLKTFRLSSTEVSYSEFVGSVSYNYGYSNSPTNVADPYIKRADISISDNYPRQYFNTFEVPNFDEIIQPMNLTTLGVRSLQMTLIGYRNALLPNYQTYARNRCNQYIPTGSNVYLNGLSYTFDSGSRTFNVNAGWDYDRSGEPFTLV